MTAPRPMTAPAPRIAALDALRGLAALTVVVHHYWMLAPAGSRPFEGALGLAYEYGRFAVPMFFLLSGYIFFEVYGDAIGARRIDARRFFWLRFSRLYPLHLLTLIGAAFLQAAALAATGDYFAYRHNDLMHFALNLTFLQFGWVDPGMSFNGPTWSLSVEAGLYVFFFFFARACGMAARPRLILAVLFFALSTVRDQLSLSGLLNPFIVEGLDCFFLGGCLQLTRGWSGRRRIALGLALLALGAGLLYATAGWREAAPVLFAGVALTAVAWPAFGRLASSKPLIWLGDISYSTYLWNTLVQISMVVFSATVAPLPFSSPATLVFYVAATLAISTLSFRYFEMPACAAIRNWTARTPRRAPVPVSA